MISTMEILEKVPDRYLGLLVDEDEREINYMSIWLCAEIVKIELSEGSEEWDWVDGDDEWYVRCYTGGEGLVYVVKKSEFKSRVSIGSLVRTFEVGSPLVPDEVKKVNTKVDKIKRMIKKETIHEFAPL